LLDLLDEIERLKSKSAWWRQPRLMRLPVSLAAVSSLVVLADVLLFWLVFRREPAELANPRSTVPAE
jgi:hypothetical protein